MNKIHIRKQQGFTLLEILIAISLLLVLIAATQPVVSRMADFRANIVTETRLQSLGMAVEEWYEENSWDFGSINTNSIPLPDGGAMATNSGTIGAGWERLANSYTGDAKSIINGYNHAYRVFVSDPLFREYKGIEVQYHVIALVSSRNPTGEIVDDRIITETTSIFDATTGILEVNNNESVYVINGFNIQKEYINQSIERLKRIARSYENYYERRYLTQGRDPSINYFANGVTAVDPSRWDVSAPIDAACTNSGDSIEGNFQLGWDIRDINMIPPLGLSTESAMSAWEEPIRVLNCGSTGVLINGVTRNIEARTPNSAAGNNILPYSAILGFHLPSGETYTETVTSKF